MMAPGVHARTETAKPCVLMSHAVRAMLAAKQA